jgi:serine/threonine-protein kinase
MSAAGKVKAGDVLGGKYRVERVLGTGGMGMVVAARHVQLGQRVALKFMLKEAMADPGNAERFAREARAAVRLQSPHTARVLDVGKLKNGEPYMVMEYLDGHDLDEVIRRNGPMPPHKAVEYTLQACEAFAEAHSLGMIHRDIKPKNLFLAQTVDGRPLVKVLDFGLAKTIGALGGDISLTATSAVFGSPQYMSPEQMRSAKDVDPRSDIWSIGVCLYEMLTTRVPFDAGGLAEICAMVLKDTVEPPSRWAQGLPPELDAVVVKCLAKNPNERYQTVAELAFALEPWSAIEGSASRILHVMQTVQKTELPTLMNASPSEQGEDGPKTMDAWDSGERTRPTQRRLPPVAWVMGGCAGLALVGLVAIGAVAFRGKSGHASAKASAGETSSSPSAATAELPSATAAPTPLPVPVPAVAIAIDPPVVTAEPSAPVATETATPPSIPLEPPPVTPPPLPHATVAAVTPAVKPPTPPKQPPRPPAPPVVRPPTTAKPLPPPPTTAKPPARPKPEDHM